MKYFKLRKFLSNIFERLLFDKEDPYFLDNVPPFTGSVNCRAFAGTVTITGNVIMDVLY